MTGRGFRAAALNSTSRSKLQAFSSHGIFRIPDLYTMVPQPRPLLSSYLYRYLTLTAFFRNFAMRNIYIQTGIGELLRRSSRKPHLEMAPILKQP
jgi:hypothetical protein